MHIACIMDGNGRWARRQGLPRTAGHTAGEENLAAVVRSAVALGVDHLTVFGFSTENWVRPKAEVRHILSLHARLFGRVAELNELNVRINWIGRRFDDPMARTPRFVQRAIRRAIADTAQNTGMVLTVAFDYGSRTEIADAVTRVVTNGAAVDRDNLSANLYSPGLPDVDVLVRTSGELRISNFLLWQCAGSKAYFTENTWPDFSTADLANAVAMAHHD